MPYAQEFQIRGTIFVLTVGRLLLLEKLKYSLENVYPTKVVCLKFLQLPS